MDKKIQDLFKKINLILKSVPSLYQQMRQKIFMSDNIFLHIKQLLYEYFFDNTNFLFSFVQYIINSLDTSSLKVTRII